MYVLRVGVGVCRARSTHTLTVNTNQHREQQTYFPYLHNHEYFALDRVLLVSVGVC